MLNRFIAQDDNDMIKCDKRRWAMNKTVKKIFITIIVIAALFPLFYFTGWRAHRSLDHYVDVEYSDIISEYPELAITEQDRDWINALIQSQKVEAEIQKSLAREDHECKFHLEDAAIDYNPLFPKDDCLIDIHSSGNHALIRITFEPVARANKAIQFGSVGFYDTEYDFWKFADVYKGKTKEAMTREHWMASYRIFHNNHFVDVPAFGIYWADMTILKIPLPRAEILK